MKVSLFSESSITSGGLLGEGVTPMLMTGCLVLHTIHSITIVDEGIVLHT